MQLDASGNAYLDLNHALVGNYEVGIQLPPNMGLLGQPTIYFNPQNQGAPNKMPLSFCDYSERFLPRGEYCAYIQNNAIFFVGDMSDWAQVSSIDIRYVPLPGVFGSLMDTFILPDSARSALVQRGAQFCGERLVGMPDAKPIDLNYYAAQANRSEELWLYQVGSTTRVKFSTIREVWTVLLCVLGLTVSSVVK